MNSSNIYFTIRVCLLLCVSTLFCQNQSIGQQRGRVKIANNTVVAENGSRLRGGPMPFDIFKKPIEFNWVTDESNWVRAKVDGHLNAMRIVFFDPWRKSQGYNYGTVDEQMPIIEQLVGYAKNNGMYAIINFHDVSRYEMDFAEEFWTKVASKFKDETHVVFELLNEPVHSGNTNAAFYESRGHYANFYKLYDIVRSRAPQSHIILFSFQNLNKDLLSVVDGFASKYPNVDWTKSSVGFHFYGAGSASYIHRLTDLKDKYPVICTEWDYPYSNDYTPVLSGELYNGQTLERLGVSWLDWRAGRKESHFQGEFLNKFKADAISKGYFWPEDNGGSGPGGGTTPTKYEAESDAQIVADANGNVNVANFDGDPGLRLMDEDDAISFQISVPTAGEYIIKARVRSGYPASPTYYFNGYDFSIDGLSLSMTGDPTSVSPLLMDTPLGDMHWGTTVSNKINLLSGTQTLRISAAYPFVAVDYITVEAAPSGARAGSAQIGFGDEAKAQVENISIYPNPVQEALNINLPYTMDGKVMLVNIHNQELLTEEFSEKNSLHLSMEDYPKGVYFVRVLNDDSKVYVQRLIKQ